MRDCPAVVMNILRKTTPTPSAPANRTIRGALLGLVALASFAITIGCADSEDEDSQTSSASDSSDPDDACDADACNQCLLDNPLDPMNPTMIPPCEMQCESCDPSTTSPPDSDSDASDSSPEGGTDDPPDDGDFGKACEDQVATGQSADCEAPTNCWAFGGPDYCTIKCSSDDECPMTFECGSVGPESQDYCKPI